MLGASYRGVKSAVGPKNNLLLSVIFFYFSKVTIQEEPTFQISGLYEAQGPRYRRLKFFYGVPICPFDPFPLELSKCHFFDVT